MKAKGLGRGLDALLGSDEPPREALATVRIGAIRPGRYQPRTRMDERALAELAQSIRSQGLLQPVVVRPVDGGYELVAGERRWRAAQMAGLEQIPAVVREVPDEAALVMALIENVQREDLNPMEEAAAVQRLIDEFRMTHEQAADALRNFQEGGVAIVESRQNSRARQLLGFEFPMLPEVDLGEIAETRIGKRRKQWMLEINLTKHRVSVG